MNVRKKFWLGVCLALAAAWPGGALGATKKSAKSTAAKPPAALAEIEADQHHEDSVSTAADDPSGKINLAAISPQYAHPSTYDSGSHAGPAAVDGSEETSWAFPSAVTEASLEISLGAPTPINRIVLKEYKGPARSHEVEYHDAQGWKQLFAGGAIEAGGHRFNTVYAGALRIKLKTAGGGGLREVEVYRDKTRPAKPEPVIQLAPARKVVGKSLEFVAFSAVNPIEGDNSGAWLRYFGVNGVRTWYTASRHVIASDLQLGDPVAGVGDFDRRRERLRADPLKSGFIHWESIARRAAGRFEEKDSVYTVDYANRLLQRLSIAPLCELNVNKWDDSWTTAWRNWVTLYAWVFHQARSAGVCRYQYANEPETFYKKITPAIYTRSVQIHADAIRSAIEDANRIAGLKLQPVFAAPVLASTGTGEMARLMMRNLRTDYHGQRVGYDLVQWFNKHRYNSRPRSYEQEIAEMNAMMAEESPLKQPLPVIYSEFNYSTGAHWDRPQVTFSSDTPQVFRNEASVWGLCALSGAKAMYQFKFADGRRKGNNVCTTLVREHDAGTPAGPPSDIGDSTRSAEVTRLFAEGFSRERPLLECGLRCADINVRPLCARDAESGRHYLWLAQPNSRADYPLQLDLRGLGLPAGALLVIKEVSASHFGEVSLRQPLPETQQLPLVQPKDSVWLIGIEAQPGRRESLEPIADGQVMQGAAANQNFGRDTVMGVAQGAAQGANRISFLRFPPVAGAGTNLSRAFLRVHGSAQGANRFSCLVYGHAESQWDETRLCAANAPAVCRTVSAVARVDLHTRPVAHLSFGQEPTERVVDVTEYVKEFPGKAITFVLIKERRLPDEDFAGQSAEVATKENPDATRRPALELWYNRSER